MRGMQSPPLASLCMGCPAMDDSCMLGPRTWVACRVVAVHVDRWGRLDPTGDLGLAVLVKPRCSGAPVLVLLDCTAGAWACVLSPSMSCRRVATVPATKPLLYYATTVLLVLWVCRLGQRRHHCTARSMHCMAPPPRTWPSMAAWQLSL